MQLPAVLWIAAQLGRVSMLLTPLPFIAATLLTWPFVTRLLKMRIADERMPGWLLHGVLYPYFAWWATSSLFFFGSGIVWLVARLCHASTTQPLGFTLGISSLLGLLSLRSGPKTVEVEVELPNLPPAFDGYRVGQISDVHCGSFTPKARVDSWVAQLNGARCDLIAITGDLVTNGNEFVDDVAQALSGLDAPDGVFACMGNHDYFCDAERLVRGMRDGGIEVLRNQGVHLSRDDSSLYIAGIEDNWSGRHDLAKTLADRKGEPTLLLAHDPNHFPAAAEQGVMLTLSGHTHGGQIGLPGFEGRYNFARLITKFTHGLHRLGQSALYVSRGAGTTGPPVRLFAPAELTVLTLRSPRT
jgi:predicted MPP superfamily phosphohydrolase